MSKKITALPASSGLAATDLFAVVDDVAGTPATQKATGTQVVSLVTSEANIASGTWTPTVAGVINVDSTAVVGVGMYMRIGDVVTAAVRVTIDPTAAGATTISLSAPVSTTFSAVESANGIAAGIAGSVIDEGGVQAQAATDDVLVSFEASSALNTSVVIHFTHLVE